MTQPTPPSDRQFARDVAKQIDRRRGRRKLTLWTALLGLVAAGAAYLRCGGHGLGLGGLGLGGAGDGDRPAASEAHCEIRLAADGLSVAGKAMSRDAAIAACKSMATIDVTITGAARHGDRQALLAALHAANLKFALHEPPEPDDAVGGSGGKPAPKP